MTMDEITVRIRNPLGLTNAFASEAGALINAVAGDRISHQWIAADDETIDAFQSRVRAEATVAKFLIWELVQ
jgi:hypothetical protein